MNTRKLLLLLLIIHCSFSLCACSEVVHAPVNTEDENTLTETEINETEESDTSLTEETIIEEVTEIVETVQPQILNFVDIKGNWYQTEILENVRKHNYNWNYLTNDEHGIAYEGDPNYTIRKGIDVSDWQGTIDWKQVADAGYEFAILRLGYRGYGTKGTMKMDNTFYYNIQNAQKYGIDVGVYFFAQAVNEAEAIEEANYVLNALKGYELQLPIVYDPELISHTKARTDNVTGEQFTKNTIAFCEAVKAAGYTPMVYSNMVWEATLFDMTQLQAYNFWYADYEKLPQTPYAFCFWQYSDQGRVPGIKGNVDLNVQFIPIISTP